MKRWLACALLGACACQAEASARDQWLIVVETDVTVPQHGDRLLLEVIDSEGSSPCGQGKNAGACQRLLGVGSAGSWPVTFGIKAPDTRAPLRVRARLFRFDSDPDRSALDVVFRLPDASGLTNVVLPLHLACFGIRPDLDAHQSCDPATATLAPERVLDGRSAGISPGDFAAAWREECPAEADGEVSCVPGGIFVLGSQSHADLTLVPSVPEKLVRVPSLWVDVEEVSVQKYLELAENLVEEPVAWDPKESAVYNACTHQRPGAETDPLNCVSFTLAEAVCAARGMRLPTEIEWEYVASNAGRETLFPWGDNDAICAHAIIARGRTEAVTSGPTEDAGCRAQADGTIVEWGVQAHGDPDDVNDFGIRNLAGNVAEWTLGSDESWAECWPGGGLITEPFCQAQAWRSVRGGDWASIPAFAHSAVRRATLNGTPFVQIGFRCVRDVSP